MTREDEAKLSLSIDFIRLTNKTKSVETNAFLLLHASLHLHSPRSVKRSPHRCSSSPFIAALVHVQITRAVYDENYDDDESSDEVSTSTRSIILTEPSSLLHADDEFLFSSTKSSVFLSTLSTTGSSRTPAFTDPTDFWFNFYSTHDPQRIAVFLARMGKPSVILFSALPLLLVQIAND